MTLIVAFGHQSGVGKNTAAAIVSDQLQLLCGKVRVSQAAFADGVKESAHGLFKQYGLQPGNYYERDRAARRVPLPVVNKTPVEIWVGVGDKMREIHSTLWIERCLGALTPCHAGLVTDLRYINEAHAVKQAGGMLVKVSRAGVVPLDTPADHDMDDWQAWDWHITNDGTMDDLRAECSRLTYHIIERLTSC